MVNISQKENHIDDDTSFFLDYYICGNYVSVIVYIFVETTLEIVHNHWVKRPREIPNNVDHIRVGTVMFR